METTNSLVSDSVNQTKSVAVRQTVTVFEQGVAAIAGFLTAGPLGSIAAWGAIRGFQGKWTPWFVLGIPAAAIIHIFQINALAPSLIPQLNFDFNETQNLSQEKVSTNRPQTFNNDFVLPDEYQNQTKETFSANARKSVIPNGKAFFKSGRTGKEEFIGVSLTSRINSNGHTVYDAAWSDGYTSSYVFWSNGQAEIFSKDGTGKNIRTAGKFERLSNGSIKIAAETNAITIFPSFNPATN